MIDPELGIKLDEIRALAERAADDARKTRQYLFWTGIITAALIIVPAIILAFVAPQFLSSYTTQLQGLGY